MSLLLALTAGSALDFTERATGSSNTLGTGSLTTTAGPDVTLGSITVPNGHLIVVFAGAAARGGPNFTIACTDTQSLTWTKYGGDNGSNGGDLRSAGGNIFTAVSNGAATVISITVRDTSGFAQDYPVSYIAVFSSGTWVAVGAADVTTADIVNTSNFGGTLDATPAGTSLVVSLAVANREYTAGLTAGSGWTAEKTTTTVSTGGSGYSFGVGTNLDFVAQVLPTPSGTTVATTTDGGHHIQTLLAFELTIAGGTNTPLAVAGTTTGTGTLTKNIGKRTTGTSTASGVLVKAAAKLLTASSTATGALAKNVGKLLTGSSTGSSTLANLRAFLRSYTGTATATGNLTKNVGKQHTGTSTASGVLVRAAAKLLTASSTATGALSKNIGKLFTGSSTGSSTLLVLRAVFLNVAGTITATGALVKNVGKRTVGSSIATGAVAKTAGKLYTGTIITVGVLARQIAKRFTAAITAAATLGNVISGASGPQSGTVCTTITTATVTTTTATATVSTTAAAATVATAITAASPVTTIAAAAVTTTFSEDC